MNKLRTRRILRVPLNSRSTSAALRRVCSWLLPLLGERVGVRGNGASDIPAPIWWYDSARRETQNGQLSH